MYIETPKNFPTQTAILEKPSAEYLPTSHWHLLGDLSVRPIWRSHCKPEPPLSTWVEVSEATKRMEAILLWLEHWAKCNVYRNHTLVVVGGGILTDMGGLAASLYLRGIAWHAWPTSLLAQIDAGIGGKVAVNLGSGKNLAGAFHHPQRVAIARCFLDSLPQRHLEAGKWELIKMALMVGDTAWAKSLLDCKTPCADDIKRAVKLKTDIVHEDFKEKNERRLLNLGHTFGHALECASNFELLHGEAVGLGVLAACILSENNGQAAFHIELIETMGKQLAHFAVRMPTWEDCLPFILRDKKNETGDEVRCIIPVPGSKAIQKNISTETLKAVHAKLLLMLNVC